MTRAGLIWLLILCAANGAALGALIWCLARARLRVRELDEAKQGAVREFARWQALADAHEAAQRQRREVLKGGPGAHADGCAPGS